MLGDLTKAGKIVPGSITPVFHSRAGVAVRAGAPKPDISTVEAFKQALLKAKTIGHSLGVSGVHFSTNVIPRLGIAEEIKSRIRISKGFPVGVLVAKGEAEIGIHQIAELMPIQGIDIVGELPAEIQTTLDLRDRRPRRRQATGGRQGAGTFPVVGDVGAGNQEERHGARAAMTRSL